MKRVLYVFVCSTVILLPFLFTVMHGSASADAERPPVSADRATPIPVTAGQKYTLVKQWGSEGNGEGQFMNPYGLALKPDGSAVYVADRDNHRIQKFDAQGNFLTQWGWYGPLPGQMRHPSAVVVDPAGGDVYVSDRDNFRIQRFTGDGEYLSEWGIEPPQVPNYDCQSCYSTFECTETLGPEWVCQDECCLNPYDPDAVEITGYTYPEKEDLEFGELLFPEQLTIAPDGLLYVSDRHRVQRVVVSFSEEIDDFVYGPVSIDERGVFAENEETGAFKGACNIANSDGESFWIIGKCGADEYHRIYKKSFRGCTVEKWASAKTPDDIDLSDWEESQGKVSNSFLAVDMLGDVYVSDPGHARIQKFSGIGEFITEWGLNGALTAPAHIQVDREGFVYVIDGNAIKKFRPVTDIGSEGTISSGSDDCDYSITPAEEIFGIGGGTASISVTPADTTCEWSAVSSVAWIVISSDSLGVGTGTVSYFVAPNDEMQSRQGSILVAGYQVVIKQNTVDMPEIICPVAFVLGEDDPRIDRLRQIRDDVLAHTAAGRSLISLYYEHSAALNEILSHNPVVKYLVKEALDSICIFGELLPKHGS